MTIELMLDGRKVIDLTVGGVDGEDFPDFSDAYFEEGWFWDNDQKLTGPELDRLGELYPEVLNSMAYEVWQAS